MYEYILAIHLFVQLVGTGRGEWMALRRVRSREKGFYMCVCGGGWGEVEGGGNEIL